MSIFGNNTTNFQITGSDIGNQFPLNNAIQRDYLIDVYPSLISTFKQSGLWTWGYNNVGQLGDDTRTNKSSPVQTISGGTNWKQVALGGGIGFAAGIKTDGTLWLWGRNQSAFGGIGNLGDNTIIHKSSPVQTVAGGTNWKLVACGNYITGAVKTDGTLWTWGHNGSGQLGDNTVIHRSSPVQTVSGGTNWKLVACGTYHTAAIKTDSTLWLWGSNPEGRLGDNTRTNKSSPVQTVAGGTNWKQVACGGTYSTAIKSDGTLWTWGANSDGQLGDNTIINKSSPVQTVSGGTNWKQVAYISNSITQYAIKTDGTLWTWGRNSYGQLGDNTVIHRSSPVQTVSGGTNWKQILGGASAAAIKTDGTLWIWGDNTYGQLGDNSTIKKSSPVQTVAGGTNWKQVASNIQTISIRDDSSDIFGDPV